MALDHETPKITQSNSLIEAAYDLSLVEKRLLVFCIAQIKQGSIITSETDFAIHYSDFNRTFKLTGKSSYENIRAGANRLYERSITIKLTPDGNPRNITKFRWITSVTVNDDDACVMIRFNEPVLPYIHELERRFTTYNLEEVSNLSTHHAIRIYEFMSQWKKPRKFRLSLDELKERLELTGKYKEPRDIRRFVIEPAVDQINESTSLNVSFDMLKTGRKVTHVDFSIMDTSMSLRQRVGL